MRIGHGFDVHAFGGEGPLTLCGVKIDYEKGFVAHSDGDVAYHAVCDALLGAVALGDIGRHFPDTDPTFKGADSGKLLAHVYGLVKDKGFQVGNLDVTIIAQAPKMAPHIENMRINLSTVLETQIDDINVKATTTEKLGYTGRKEGISVHAVTLLTRIS